MKFTDTIKNKAYQFLKNSEKYTKTDNIYLVKGGFWLSITRIVSTGASFLLALTYANFLGPELFGNYKYVLSLASVFIVFSLPGMATAFVQAVARGFEGGFYKIPKIKIKYGYLGSLAAFILAVYYYIRGNSLLAVPLLVIGASFPFYHAFKIYDSLLTGRRMFDTRFGYTIFQKLTSSLSLILVVVLLGKYNLSANTALIFLIAVYFLVPALINFIFYNKIREKFKPNIKEDEKTISYGKHLSLMSIISPIAERLDQILIFHYLGAAELAIYSFAIYPINEIEGFLGIIPVLAFPKFSQRTKEELKRTFFKKILQLIVFAFLITVVFIILAPIFYKIFLPNYLESIIFSQVFAISFLIPKGLPVKVLESQMAIKKRYFLAFFAKITRILLMFVLVLSFGIWGIIIGRIISGFLNFLLSLFLVKNI